MFIKKITFSAIFALAAIQGSIAQELSPEVRVQIATVLNEVARKEISIGKITIDSAKLQKDELILFANTNCSYIPFRENNVLEIYSRVRTLLTPDFSNCKVKIYADKKAIEDLIPTALRSRKEKGTISFTHKSTKPLTTRLSNPFAPTKGLVNRHIALWQSHGYYYEAKLSRWEWQRARVFQTVEDLFTQSYVLPYLVPMLENAGANVLVPRERDTQVAEVIIDNDNNRDTSIYSEINTDKEWQTGSSPGFAHFRNHYVDFENPFKEGTYRFTQTVKKGKENLAEWIPSIPETGNYAVYVSYQTVDNSTDDALYTIYHKGGVSRFKVNQTMGGGTWIYLGHFSFDKGKNSSGKVVLSNRSSKSGRIVTADAVKIGGGYGNIARRVSPCGIVTENRKSSDDNAPAVSTKLPQIDYPYETSGYPRFTEAARYWMQWAGIPDSIYSESHGQNDYTDDYKSRGLWVNYLAGGSAAAPNDKGLNIPVDMAFAFHSDAGTTPNDSIIGTLGIFQTAANDGIFANGASRYASRDLTDLIQSHIVNDIRRLYKPNWTRRGMWNQSYYEARVPKVPTMLLELLSHQNFADMRYGLDPRFRFTVSRAIYKGMLQFLANQYKQDYVVQPLPVDHMSARFTKDTEVELTWQPVDDPLEPTAKAEQYIVYTRIGEGDFDNGILVNKNSYRTNIPSGVICSYKVTAVNKGGESFPSEILSVGKAIQTKGTVLVINGFDRISAPADFVAPQDSIAGFLDQLDHGVPYKTDISYIGSMKEFRRNIPWMDDDASGFGDSYSNYETKVIAGNSFDYPAIHGKAILKAGYSFVSCSDEVIENGSMSLQDYPFVDLILGKEKQTKMGRGAMALEFKTFTPSMQQALTDYCQKGGSLFISGAYVGSDLWDNPMANQTDKDFATEVLKYKWRAGQAAIEGKVKSVTSPYSVLGIQYTYYNELNAESYVVESPDAIEPATNEAFTVLRYSENNLSAGIAYKGKYKTFVTGFPFESLRSESERESLMKSVLDFFDSPTE